MKRIIILLVCVLICSGCIKNEFTLKTEEIDNGYIVYLSQENKGVFTSYGTNEYDAIHNAINAWIERDKPKVPQPLEKQE